MKAREINRRKLQNEKPPTEEAMKEFRQWVKEREEVYGYKLDEWEVIHGVDPAKAKNNAPDSVRDTIRRLLLQDSKKRAKGRDPKIRRTQDYFDVL
jgi:hypothetical protein